MRVGGTVYNTLKGGETKKRGAETKILKRWGKLGQGVGPLKRGDSNPLTDYEYYLQCIIIYKLIMSFSQTYSSIEYDSHLLTFHLA